MQNNILVIHPKDNVAVAVATIEAGALLVGGGVAGVHAVEVIPPHHKVALAAMAAGAPVIKYGETIARAKTDIAAGAWVHTHNLKGGEQQ